MQNTQTLTFDCYNVTKTDHIVSSGNEEDLAALADFMEVMAELGIKVNFYCLPKGGTRVMIDYPYQLEAKEYAHRGSAAERPIPTDSPLKRMELDQQLAWLEDHTTEDGMKALGLKRAAFFKRKKRMQEKQRMRDAVKSAQKM